ncbi:hypothetical protein U9M48_012574 [Paspalum notatum var. saurae]|uniref:Cyclopropane-fatty-acyl-phospholipid synthase n=1 Tax=Paspalum notatum var. saurae TaxID=547442 RepID=A0AAQ3SZY3_PASNO
MEDNGGTGCVLVDLGFMAFDRIFHYYHRWYTEHVDPYDPSLFISGSSPMVGNEVAYPNMVEWFEKLGVEMEPSDMSFSASIQLSYGKCFEWGSHNGISRALVPKSNLLNPRFWVVIHEIIKFKNHALRYLEDNGINPDWSETSGQFIQSNRYSQLFRDAYLLFGSGRPQWLTVKGGSESYVNKVRDKLESMSCQIKTGCEVTSVSSFNEGEKYCATGYRILEADGSVEIYESIIFIVHAADALKVLGAEATHEELRVLGTFQYICRDVYLHCDKSMMPRSSSAWSAMNFLGTTSIGVCFTYWLNVHQNIGSSGPLFATFNPARVPNHVLLKWHTSHPTPSMAAAKATLELNNIQGKRGIWFCGRYQGDLVGFTEVTYHYGFHEDSVKAGKAAALGLLGRKCDLLANPKQMVPYHDPGRCTSSVSCTASMKKEALRLILVKHVKKGHVKSVIRVHDPQFYWKVATEAELGFAYAYINGYISFVDNKEGLLNIILIFIANGAERRRLSSNASKSSYVRKGWWTHLLGITGVAHAKYSLRHASRKNSVSKARSNISEHYDLSNDFFAFCLDPSMSYSCAIYKVDDENLEAAQQRKNNYLINKAKVEPEHHVLEIGCGWGSLAIQFVKKIGCKYSGITLSEQQLKHAKRKVKEAGLEDRITFLLCDYRQIPTCHNTLDRLKAEDQRNDLSTVGLINMFPCCSFSEMIEHVGHEYMDDFLGAMSLPEQRYDKVKNRPDFLREYIFPGGCLPSLAQIVSAMSNASRLCVQHVENIGDHYYTTLIHWRDNFMANRQNASALGFDEKLIRTWEYYLNDAAALFKSRIVMNYQRWRLFCWVQHCAMKGDRWRPSTASTVGSTESAKMVKPGSILSQPNHPVKIPLTCAWALSLRSARPNRAAHHPSRRASPLGR